MNIFFFKMKYIFFQFENSIFRFYFLIQWIVFLLIQLLIFLHYKKELKSNFISFHFEKNI